MSLIGCNTANSVCLYRSVSAETTLITIDAKVPDSNGWAAFGIGKSMIGSPLYVFWRNTTGGCVVSSRIADEYELPEFSNNQLSSVTNLDSKVSASQVSGSNLRCTITRPTGQSPPLEKDFIWAIGSGVATIDNRQSTFQQHSAVGTLNVKSNAASISAVSAISLIVSSILFL